MAIKSKKGMDAWQLVLIVLAVLLLLFMLIWYGVLRQDLENLSSLFGGLF